MYRSRRVGPRGLATRRCVFVTMVMDNARRLPSSTVRRHSMVARDFTLGRGDNHRLGVIRGARAQKAAYTRVLGLLEDTVEDDEAFLDRTRRNRSRSPTQRAGELLAQQHIFTSQRVDGPAQSRPLSAVPFRNEALNVVAIGEKARQLTTGFLD